jgi:beige protein homolog 1
MTSNYNYGILDVGESIRKVHLFGEKVAAATKEQAFMLPDGAKYIEWGYSDKSLRFHSSEGKKVYMQS